MNILLVDNNEEELELLKKSFTDNGDKVMISDYSADPISVYDKFPLDMIVMDFSENPKKAYALTERFVEFDTTSCIFGLINPDQDIEDSGYKSGARVMIRRNKIDNLENEIVNITSKIINSCDEMTKGFCSACWEQNRYVELN